MLYSICQRVKTKCETLVIQTISFTNFGNLCTGTAKSRTFRKFLFGNTYWKIGQYIVEYEQGGSEKAEYGKRLLEQLSKDLSLLHGKGFSLSNMKGFAFVGRQYRIMLGNRPHRIDLVFYHWRQSAHRYFDLRRIFTLFPSKMRRIIRIFAA